jgi:hypothetical protein
MTYEGDERQRCFHVPSAWWKGADLDLAGVEDRMAEAMRHWWRSPDSEARFSLGGRISSIWRQAFTDKAGADRTAGHGADAPEPLPLSRADIARMKEASEWMRFVPEADRRLVVMVLVKLASGHKTVPWLMIWKALGRGKPGPEGLRSATAGRSPRRQCPEWRKTAKVACQVGKWRNPANKG